MKLRNVVIASLIAVSSVATVGKTWADHRGSGEYWGGHGWSEEGKGRDCGKGKRGHHGMRGHDSMGMMKGGRFTQQDLKLDAAKVKTLMEAKLIMRADENLKLGDIKAGEKKTFIVDINNAEGSLVKQVTISSATGRPVDDSKRIFDKRPAKNTDRQLTAEQVKTLMSARLIRRGNERLKVGAVTAGENDTYTVEIMTIDDSLVKNLTISTKTGRPVFN